MKRFLLLVAIGVLGSSSAEAVHTRFWEIIGYESMLAGKTDGLSLTPTGALLLSPDLLALPLDLPGVPPQPFLWRAVEDSQNNLYIGSGIQGLVYRVTAAGEVSTFFQAPEIEVHALAIGSDDAVFVAGSPPGRVYRVEPDGEASIYFEPQERYVWDLALDRSGNLFVATGEQGVLYRVDPAGEATVHFDADEPHLVSLAVDIDGVVFAGGSGSGRVYRIGPDGSADVLLDAAAVEVVAVGLTPRGTLYAAMNTIVPPKKEEDEDDKQKDRLAGELPRSAVPALQGLEDLAGSAEELFASGRHEVALQLRSALYRLPAVGPVVQVWESADEGIHSLLADGEDRVYFGTGVPGRIYLMQDDDTSPRLLARFPESQVTALAGTTERTLYAVTSNPGRLYRAAEEYGHSGEYLSEVRDAEASARWGQVRWDALAPAGSRVEISSRSGNSSAPDSTWSDWSPPYEHPDGTRIVSPPARFLQLRARLSRLGDAPTPQLRGIQVSYQEENRPPRLGRIRIAPPEEDDSESGKAKTEPRTAQREGSAPLLAVSWLASDPNRDEMKYDLYLMTEPEPAGPEAPAPRLLVQDHRESTYTWKTTGTPGGRYRVEVRVSDAPDNDVRSALETQGISEAVVIDHDPPSIELLSSGSVDGEGRISFRASDAVSPVVRAVYSVDGQAAQYRISPVDGMDDSRDERYELSLAGLSPGRYEVKISIRDREGNQAHKTVSLEISP